ncbi:MAG: adenylate/guanylate cyclase domain-containing protein [Chloroflexota bacterium]|nr:MAG: adenylate/guanylate cyclase domain-containing protein [Chloroflexota bacterium]
MNIQTFFAYDPSDTDETRVEKFAIFLVAGACCLAGVIWTLMYYVVFGFGLITLLPFSFVVIVGLALIVSHFTKNHYFAIYAQIICIIYVPTFIQWSVGGVYASGLVIVWAFLGPIISMMFFSVRQSIIWVMVFLVNLAITFIFNDFFASNGQLVPESTRLILLFMNLTFASAVMFIFAGYFVTSALNEREKANRLLLNVLPKEIAPILKGGQMSVAEHYESASVLFADIVGSTPLFSDLTPEEAVDWLNEVFTMFDGLVEKYGLEKIRTIGDNYMVASGVPVPTPDHAEAIGNLALDMIQQLKEVPARNGKRLEFRVGINSGPLVAGVIGQSKFHYDLYGDTVNTASRMESHGEAGRVQLAQGAYDLLKEEFECIPRGRIAVKGKDDMETWFLTGRR